MDFPKIQKESSQ